jgi:acylphosphatase
LTIKKARLLIREKDKKVQEVGFRLCLLKEAQKRFIKNFFAENLPDGKTVAVILGGEPGNVDRYVAMIQELGQGNPLDYEVSVEEYRGSIMRTSEYASYLTAEQLLVGVGALGGISGTLECMDKTLEGMGGSLSHMDGKMGNVDVSLARIVEQLDELPRKIAAELKGS